MFPIQSLYSILNVVDRLYSYDQLLRHTQIMNIEYPLHVVTTDNDGRVHSSH